MLLQFRKLQKHADFLSHMDQDLGDMNNPERLRDLIKNEAYILAITVDRNKDLDTQLKIKEREAEQLQYNLEDITSKGLALEKANADLV